MEIYSTLFDSMVVDCLERMGVRWGLIYTAAMMALGLGICLNLLSVMDLLWALGLLSNPYGRGNVLHPQHYVYGLLCCGFIANTVLARIKFNRDCQRLRMRPEMQNSPISVRNSSFIRSPGPAYILSSAVLFLASATLALLVRR